jgi:general secretion pathway protein J
MIAHPRAQHGFTLIEMLVSIGLMAVLVTVSVQIYLGIHRAEERARHALGRDRAAQVLLDRIERELVGAVLILPEAGSDPLLQPYVFVGEDRRESDAEADSLRFVSRTAHRPYGSLPVGLRTISYTLRSADDDVGLDLLRNETPVTLERPRIDGGGDAHAVARHLAGFALRYRAEAEATWLDAWDSSGVSHLDDLPAEVELTVQLLEPTDGDAWIAGREHRRTIQLPVRPVSLVPEAESTAESTQCEDGPTFDECFAQAEAQLAPLRASVDAVASARISEIEAARAEVEDACWSPQDPSPALERLKRALDALDIELESPCDR